MPEQKPLNEGGDQEMVNGKSLRLPAIWFALTAASAIVGSLLYLGPVFPTDAASQQMAVVEERVSTPKQGTWKRDEANEARKAIRIADARRILLAAEDAVSAGTSMQSVTKKAEIGGAVDVTDLRFSLDGKKIFADRYGGTSIIWEPTNSAGFRIIQCRRLMGDGSRCIKSELGDSGMKVVEASTSKELYSLSDDKNDKVAVSTSGSYIAVAAVTDGITLFDAKSGTSIGHLASTWGFDIVLFSSDESLLVASDAQQFVVYDLKRRKQMKIDVTDVLSFGSSKKGDLLWVASGFADPQVLTTNGKRVSRKFPERLSVRYEHSEFGGFVDSDSKVVMKSLLGDVGVWNWKSNDIAEIPTKAKRLSVAEKGFLTLTEEGVMELWNSNTTKAFTFPGSMRFGVMGADGAHIITVSREGLLTLWDVR